MNEQYQPPSDLRDFVGRAVVPALLERFLREMRQREADTAAAGDSRVASTPEQV